MNPISKDQLCWVLVRLIGVFFLYQTGAGAFALFSMFSMMGNLGSVNPGSPFGSGSGVLGPLFLVTAFYGAMAFYGLLGGETLHRLLMSESPSHPDETSRRKDHRPAVPIEPVDPVTTLTEGETARFREWLSENPEHTGRLKEDQIALFRDAQQRGELS